MSKYRITIKPSWPGQLFTLGFHLLLIISVFSWQENIVAHQFLFQCLLVFCLLILAIRRVITSFRARSPRTISLSEDGQWTDLIPAISKNWQLSGSSLISSWFLCLLIENRNKLTDRHWNLVFRSQLAEVDFRRLSRTILKLRHNKTSQEDFY